MTALGTVCPAEKFKFDAVGLVGPLQTVMNPLAVGWVTVTFMATAAICDDGGMLPTPPICRVSVPLGPSADPPRSLRVSSRRTGVLAT